MNPNNEQKPNRPGNSDDAKIGGNPPVSPAENYDLTRIDKDRRLFGNGDTDREDLKP